MVPNLKMKKIMTGIDELDDEDEDDIGNEEEKECEDLDGDEEEIL